MIDLRKRRQKRVDQVTFIELAISAIALALLALGLYLWPVLG